MTSKSSIKKKVRDLLTQNNIVEAPVNLEKIAKNLTHRLSTTEKVLANDERLMTSQI